MSKHFAVMFKSFTPLPHYTASGSPTLHPVVGYPLMDAQVLPGTLLYRFT